MYCTNCGKEFEGKFCPECGAPANTKEASAAGKIPTVSAAKGKNAPKKKGHGCLIVVLVVLVVFIVLAALGSGGTSSSSSSSQASVSSSIVTQRDPVESTSQSVAGVGEDLTLGQKNALASAKSYISFTAFSRDGLVAQLEYEGYTTEESEYGADNCGADWNEQALISAKNYLSFSAFSYSGLIKQLEYEKFTTEQATYGVDHCGADWNEQAAKCAKSYLDYSSFSRDGLISQLEYEGFTHEQAVYGVEQNGY